MAVWVKWDKFTVTEFRNGEIFKCRMIGHEWFEMGRNPMPQSGTEEKPDFWVPTSEDCKISKEKPS